jgi:hypothetical protein
MNLDDLIPAPNSRKVAQIASKTFGYTIDFDKLTQEKALKLRESFAGKLAHIETKLGAKIGNNKSYLQNKLFLEAIDKFIAEGEAVEEYAVEEVHEELHTNESVISEGTLENSELVLAAKDMVDKIQAMVEDLGEMQNEQLGPLTDAIRDEMGTDIADQFKVAMEQVVVSALENMRASRDAADQASRILQGEAPAPMMGPEEEPTMEPTTDMDMDMEQPAGDDFGAADAAQADDEELGRERRD